jgi:hypothetical protein
MKESLNLSFIKVPFHGKKPQPFGNQTQFIYKNTMKILIIGGGGREHALAWKISRDENRPTIYIAPGNAGTAQLGVNLPIQAEDIPGIMNWAGIDRSRSRSAALPGNC